MNSKIVADLVYPALTRTDLLTYLPIYIAHFEAMLGVAAMLEGEGEGAPMNVHEQNARAFARHLAEAEHKLPIARAELAALEHKEV